MNVVQGALASRRFNRWLFVLGTVVLVAGIVAILIKVIGNNNGHVKNAAPTGPPISIPKAQKNIHFPAAGWKVAKEFLMTAPARKDLARSYELVDSNVRGGLTLKQWKTGNIPVPYFPIEKIVRYNWKNTNFAHPRDAVVNLILVPTRKSGLPRASTFQIEVIKVGQGASAHWVVDYFGAVQGVPVPSA